jgi:regulation of enolase protein 1 (concanavalin A-like superfamily)
MFQAWCRATSLPICVLAMVLCVFAAPNEAIASGISVIWDPSPDVSVIGYKVYVGTSSNFYTQHFDVGNLTWFMLPNAVQGQRYYFAVAAYSALAEGRLSAEVAGSLPASGNLWTGSTTTLLPAGWLSQDIGAVAVPGSASESSGVFTLRGNGPDVWGVADALHFAHRQMTGDGTITARVVGMAGADPWTKVGIMIRATTAPGAAHAFMLASIGKGLAFQRRVSDGGVSTHTAGAFVGAPSWLKLTRHGNVITAYESTNGSVWTLVGQDTFFMPATVLVGLAVSSHDTSTLAPATFDQVSVTSGSLLPSGWTSQDVGAVGIAGRSTQSGGTFTVAGAGGDIWGTADAFHFVGRVLPGDGKLIARVASLSAALGWAKAGVMVRQSLNADSAHGLMLVSATKGAAFQRRAAKGELSASSGVPGTAPIWVKVSRVGTSVTAATSVDGVAWNVVGQATVSVTGALYFGLVTSSHDPAQLAVATFDHVILSTDP